MPDISTAFELIMFDLDGTLVDTAPEICDTVNDVLRLRNLPRVSETGVRAWIGQGARELLRRAYKAAADEQTVNDDDLDRLMHDFSTAHEKRCGSRSHIYPTVEATLAALRARGLRLAVVTNKQGRFAEMVLRRHGLRDFFDPVIAGDSLEVRKPHPAMIEHCLSAHDVPASKALLIGDSATDVATGRNAGIFCWVVPYGYNGGHSIATANPERIIPNLGALL